MKKNFWLKLKKSIMCLAPMDDVTDAAFRFMVAKYGKPDVMFTEFTSIDGLCSDGRKNLIIKLKYDASERPIVAQIFGSDPNKFFKTAKFLAKLKFDGLDINAGCPDKVIIKSGAGCALLKNLDLAQEIIKACQQGAPNLPVSIKTRIGFNKDDTEEITSKLLKAKPTALILHCRTKKELSKTPADWEAIKRAVKVRDQLKSKTLVIGNGDVMSLIQGQKLAQKTGADGIMYGRTVLGQPWFFSGQEMPLAKKLNILLEHTQLYEKFFQGQKNFAIMKKHFKAYVTGFIGAKALRINLMQTSSYQEVAVIVKKFLGNTN